MRILNSTLSHFIRQPFQTNTDLGRGKAAFTLVEMLVVIAVGVLAALLTGFMYVFAPAAAGINMKPGKDYILRTPHNNDNTFTVLTDAGMDQLRSPRPLTATQQTEILTKITCDYTKRVQVPGM